jgi:tetraacyldisaccharide 4'-kinase
VLEPLTRAVANADLRRRLAGRAEPPATPRVVSLGALAVGGSGKTPAVLSLAVGLLARGHAVGIVTRGYGSTARGPLTVDVADPRCGDEARLMAARLPAGAVVQARDRTAGLDLLRATRPELAYVLLEDGHQCAGQGRHLDVLILDRWRETPGGVVPETGLRLPWGPYREGPAGATRAGIWLVPVAPGEALPARTAGGATVLGFERRVLLPTGMAAAPDMPYGVVSAVADPGRFEADCAALTGSTPALVVRFDDHAPYGRADVDDLLAEGAAAGVRTWLTTAKDHVKLAPLWPPLAAPLRLVELELVWRGAADLAAAVLARLEA